ncbi:MAG: plasmid mobilization protein [Acutalibacteraceae bacterium]
MSAKNRDEHNRWRNKTVAFRMSPEEAKLLDEFVKLSGLNKQDYLINRVLQREVVVQGNPRVYKALRNELMDLTNQLKNINQLDEEFLSILKQSLTILSDMNNPS